MVVLRISAHLGPHQSRTNCIIPGFRYVSRRDQGLPLAPQAVALISPDLSHYATMTSLWVEQCCLYLNQIKCSTASFTEASPKLVWLACKYNPLKAICFDILPCTSLAHSKLQSVRHLITQSLAFAMIDQWSPPEDYHDRPVCVLGGGVLGRRIAACFVAAGYHVRVRDPSAKSRADAVQYIKDNLSSFLSNLPRLPNREGTYEAIENFAAAVKDCWIVFEAVPEVLPLKESTFADLEKMAPEDCILASNSSSFKSGDLLSKVKERTKTRVLNTHYMMPPKVPLNFTHERTQSDSEQSIIVELMTSGHTIPDILQFLEARHKEAGLHPVTALRESSGFIFNRIWAAIKREVLAVLAEGVSTPDVIDSIWREQYGSPVGPCAMMG